MRALGVEDRILRPAGASEGFEADRHIVRLTGPGFILDGAIGVEPVSPTQTLGAVAATADLLPVRVAVAGPFAPPKCYGGDMEGQDHKDQDR